MKLSSLSALCALLLPLPLAGQDGFTPLFNGRDLSGWEGDPELWKVEDGIIVGTCTGPNSPEHNTFLIWRGGLVKDFELHAKVRVEGDNNSGIQYRSRLLEGFGTWAITGYQCDIHPAVQHTAMTYEEKGRGIFGLNGQSVVLDPAGNRWLVAERDPVQVDVSQWQDYTVIARGNHLVHQVNGRLTSELTDYDEKGRALEGLLAIQLHRGNANRVFVKDIRIKTLTDAKVIPFERSNIPSDAQRIEKPVTNNPQGKTPNPPQAPKAGPKAGAKASAKAGAKAAAKAAPKAKTARPQAVGPAIGENKATPVGRIKALPGFEVELLYSVPGGDQGSWVALAQDDQGRIYASDQYGDLYRFNAPAAGQPLRRADVKKLPLNIRAINGMVFAYGALYAGVNDYEQKTISGLYRITDSNDDGDLDKAELLRAFDSKSDHGVHKVLPTPDGKGLYLITGNNAIIEGGPIDGTAASSPVPKIWGDDHLLPRMPDGRGHNRHVLAPGGIVYRMDPDGKNFEIFASGFRNIYGGGVNRDGELFTYDADMEYDFNTSWYRPTRVNHVVSGGEYGWRNGAGKYPEFYADNLPATLNIGPGSPTGTTFGHGAKFPAKYQEAFYVLDWSWGKLYAVHLQEAGASYTATKEEFITGAPLPLTDAFIGKDGAMYFAIGGRRVQSGLYRVTYSGKESTAPVALTARPSPLRDLRHQLEAFHGRQDPKAVDAAWPHLNHADRSIRWAARVALEHQPVATWKERALQESDAGRQLEALLALARVAGKCPSHRPAEFQPDAATLNALIAALLKLDFAKLSHDQQLTHVRTLQITLHRLGDPAAATVQQLIAQLDPAYPAKSFELNWLLTETLAHLQAPNTAAKALSLIATSPSQEPQIEFARSLRHLKAGWTPELRTKQLEWFLTAASFRGGASFSKFIEFIRQDSLATFTDAEKTQLAALIEKKPEVKSAYENVGAIFMGRTPTMWTLEELSAAARDGMKNRDFDNGLRMFGAAACFACHRFGNAGGMTGPDLTGAGGRYSPHDLLDQIINPSKEINEQFAPIVVSKNNGEIISGVVVNLNGDTVTLNTDLSDPDQRATIDRKEVKSIEVSKVSPMPPMLLNMLKKEEVLDLLAYVLSGGDRANAMFKN
jgi:putative heme-binding domain-containing protein